MTREEIIDIFNRIPELEQTKSQIIMRAGPALSVETILRYEPTYMVMRGREAGNQDDGRAFFVPYVEMVFVKIEASVKLSDIETWFSDSPSAQKKSTAPKEVYEESNVETPAPMPAVPMDPASIAKQNLLDRIRAARTSAGNGRSTVTK